MNSDELMLIEPTEVLRQAYIDFVDEFHAVGDPHVAGERDEVLGDFSAFVRRLRNHAIGVDLPEGWVPASTYWLVREGRVVGACGLRHSLTESLRDFGGHVCYGVRPSERRKGYATFMLRAMIAKARAMGIERVLVTCGAGNVASAGVIDKCGGLLDSESYSPTAERVTRRYWIEAVGSQGQPPESPHGGAPDKTG